MLEQLKGGTWRKSNYDEAGESGERGAHASRVQCLASRQTHRPTNLFFIWLKL